MTEEIVKVRKILILGGAMSQIPAIIRAKELGYYTITCDYLPDNPGHVYSDKYENISTVDKDEILEFARKENIDGIIAYASDPSAPSVGYVCDKLHLSGANYDITKTFCEKDLFRQFQRDNGFLTPWFFSIKDIRELDKIKGKIGFPCVVKPVDCSGSKGVKVIEQYSDLKLGVENAMEFSRCKRAIIEQYIEPPYCQLHGDGIVAEGKLKFLALGDQRFKESVPIGSSFPSRINPQIMQHAIQEVSKLIELSKFECGGINVEVRVSNANQVYIIEIGPRTGGNYIPQLMELATGFDEMTASLKLAMGENYEIDFPDKLNCCFQYIVGSDEDGIFQELYIDDYMQKKVVKSYVHKKQGDIVQDYKNSNGVVGVVLLRFSNMQEMEQDIMEIKEHIKVIVKERTDEK